jgi:hypothetical protein
MERRCDHRTSVNLAVRLTGGAGIELFAPVSDFVSMLAEDTLVPHRSAPLAPGMSHP